MTSAIDQITHAISLRQHGHMFTLRLISPRCLTILAYIADLPAERSRPGAKLARPLTRACRPELRWIPRDAKPERHQAPQVPVAVRAGWPRGRTWGTRSACE
jgi:hypothetical protein